MYVLCECVCKNETFVAAALRNEVAVELSRAKQEHVGCETRSVLRCMQVGMSRRTFGRRYQNESLTLAGIWPEIERGLQQIFFARRTVSRKEYMELYTYPLSLHTIPSWASALPSLAGSPSLVRCVSLTFPPQ